MSKLIALLSGKGGSGKTTLSLCMSNLLSCCDKKILFVDCDMSTNGATYFFESRLESDGGKAITTFSDIIMGKCNEDIYGFLPLPINNNFFFIPSITSVDQYDYSIEIKENGNRSIQDFCRWAKKKYDIVFFDCQAGYSPFLPELLPIMDTYLVVSETDAISSSALRVFHVKIAKYINQLKVYQVFNKASREEFEIYSKISGGTLFTIIDTIEYNWQIRKDFALAQVPDFRSGNARFWQQICNLCAVLFREDVYPACEEFKETILLPQIEKELDIVNEERLFGTKNRKYKIRVLITSLISIYTSVASIFIFLLVFAENKFVSDSFIISLLLSCVTGIALVSAFFTIRQVLNFMKDLRYDDSKYKDKKEELLRMIEELGSSKL